MPRVKLPKDVPPGVVITGKRRARSAVKKVGEAPAEISVNGPPKKPSTKKRPIAKPKR